MLNWLKRSIVAIAMGIPTFGEKEPEKHDVEVPIERVKPSKLLNQGTVQQVNKHYGRTIAGGPGSQKIGDTFDRLPQHMKDQMIEARKGKIRYPTRDEMRGAISEAEGDYVPQRNMGRGIDAAIGRVYGDTAEKRLATVKEIDKELAAQRAASPTGRLEDFEKKESPLGKE